MKSLIIDKELVNNNIWKENPYLLTLKTFKYIYDSDNSEGKEESSKYIWAIYLVYDLEMRQLCRIKQELLWRPSVSIVCMDYQAEIIREYLGEKVIIYELNTENVMKYLINDIGE